MGGFCFQSVSCFEASWDACRRLAPIPSSPYTFDVVAMFIADRRGNQEYRISHAWLTEVENGKSMPGISRLHALSLIYGRPFDELVAFYGINIRDIGKELLPLGLPRTHLIGPTLEEARRTILAPVEMRAKVQLEKTNLAKLVFRMFQSWGEIPIALLQQMDWRNSLYGYIARRTIRCIRFCVRDRSWRLIPGRVKYCRLPNPRLPISGRRKAVKSNH